MNRFNLFSIAAIALSTLCLAPVAAETIGTARQPGVAPPACDADTQLALNLCAGRWARTADFLRSLIYEDLYRQLSEPLQSQLVATEQTWNTFRESHCQETSAPYQGGSIHALIYQSCRARVTNDRIADLQALSEPDLETEDAAIRLRELLALKLTAQSTQRQWNRYRTAHCRFEAQRLEEPATQQPCRDRLTARRIRQLEDRTR
jgi:uncharacterized protein YecT (DUF1311 family)